MRALSVGLTGGPVHFVTHSLGALVLRALSERNAVPAGGRAVLLAPPNSGSEVADRLRELAVLDPSLDRWLGPLAGQLGTRKSDLAVRLPPPAIPFGVIAGDHWINSLGALWLSGPPRRDGQRREHPPRGDERPHRPALHTHVHRVRRTRGRSGRLFPANGTVPAGAGVRSALTRVGGGRRRPAASRLDPEDRADDHGLDQNCRGGALWNPLPCASPAKRALPDLPAEISRPQFESNRV